MSKTTTVQKLHEKLNNPIKEKKIVCVDVRTEGEHDAVRIPNTRNIPIDQLKNHIAELKKYGEVYVYCASGNRSQIACEILEKYGLENYYDVEGGLNAWKTAKLPVVGNHKKRIPIMRQVLIVAGTVVLAGLICKTIFNNELFLLLPLAISIGFLYAGFSGNCLMTKILIKAPWNQHKD